MCRLGCGYVLANHYAKACATDGSVSIDVGGRYAVSGVFANVGGARFVTLEQPDVDRPKRTQVAYSLSRSRREPVRGIERPCDRSILSKESYRGVP
jgi:hypothetical protein